MSQHDTGSRGLSVGALAPNTRTPGFTAEFDLSVVRPGPLPGIVRSKDGREWPVFVQSQGGAPYLERGIGGVHRNPPSPPVPSLDSIWRELCRLWDSDPAVRPDRRMALMSAGFVDRPRRPLQGGGQPVSPERLAARVRRHHVDRDERPPRLRTWTHVEHDDLRRARREGVWSRGSPTAYGVTLLAGVDAAEKAILNLVTTGDTMVTRDELRGRVSRGIADAAIDAAIDELVARGEVRAVPTTCADCGQVRVEIRRSSAQRSVPHLG